jgi:hypothetical protein
MTTETLEQLETRMRRLHADHLAEQPLDLRHADAAQVAAFERQHGLNGHPVPAGRQPPGAIRSNVWPRPVAAPEGKSAFEMSPEELRSFETLHGLSGWR